MEVTPEAIRAKFESVDGSMSGLAEKLNEIGLQSVQGVQALSNLSEVCKNLRFSIGDILHEIIESLHVIVQFDKAIEVRRAGVFVIKSILEGLGDDALVVLQSKLKDIWRTLIAQRNSEPDEIMQVHIQQAIEAINEIVKKLFQPGSDLQKTIYVLDQPPPNPFV